MSDFDLRLLAVKKRDFDAQLRMETFGCVVSVWVDVQCVGRSQSQIVSNRQRTFQSKWKTSEQTSDPHPPHRAAAHRAAPHTPIKLFTC